MSYTPQILIDNKNNYPNEPALSVKQNNEWQTLSWSEYYDFVIKISKSLIACGIKPGDKGSIYSYNRKEWFGCYSALQMINSASVGVYHTSSAPEVEWSLAIRIQKSYLLEITQMIMVIKKKCQYIGSYQ